MRPSTSSRIWSICRGVTGRGRWLSRIEPRPTRTTSASASTASPRAPWACWRPSGAARTTASTASPRTPSSSAPRASPTSRRSFSLIYTNLRWVRWFWWFEISINNEQFTTSHLPYTPRHSHEWSLTPVVMIVCHYQHIGSGKISSVQCSIRRPRRFVLRMRAILLLCQSVGHYSEVLK